MLLVCIQKQQINARCAAHQGSVALTSDNTQLLVAAQNVAVLPSETPRFVPPGDPSDQSNKSADQHEEFVPLVLSTEVEGFLKVSPTLQSSSVLLQALVVPSHIE